MILLLVRLYRQWRARVAASAGSDLKVSTRVRDHAPAAGGPGVSAAARGVAALVVHQATYDLRASFRNPRARFFTFLFPVLLLVILSGIFGHGTTTVAGVRVPLSRFYVGGILAMSIITAAYAMLVVSIAGAREAGVLKRRRATPVPSAVLIAGQVLATLATVGIMTTLLLVIARIAYHVSLPATALVAVVVTTIVGTVTFACIAYAVSGLIGSADAAQPVVQLTVMPLYFISGIWVPTADLGHGLRQVASIFPVEHLAAALHGASVHGSLSAALSGSDLAALGLWALAAGTLAARRFQWLPAQAAA
jgi:ABC-2 type transport system permease protein